MRFHLEGLTKKEENVKLTCKTWKMNENCLLIFFGYIFDASSG